ncbi:MAG: hypothetical protein HY927_03615 [Elusimicrobia bacterium]|nr:hypothetical protein [Elusimicrobiota bacterium]
MARARMTVLSLTVAAGALWAAAGAWAGEGGPKADQGAPRPAPVMNQDDRVEAPAFDEDGDGRPEGRGRHGRRGPSWAGETREGGEEEALAFIREAAPGMEDEFQRVKRERPAAFRKRLRQYMPMLKDPAMREGLARQMRLELGIRRAAQELRKADGERKAALKKDLQKSLSEQFDAKLELQVKRLQKMKDELSTLEGRIAKRRGLKDEIVKKRLAELSGESESWEW